MNTLINTMLILLYTTKSKNYSTDLKRKSAHEKSFFDKEYRTTISNFKKVEDRPHKTQDLCG
jgi:hypothetical protein